MPHQSTYFIALFVLLCGQPLFAKNTMVNINATAHTRGTYVVTEVNNDENSNLFIIHHRKKGTRYFTSSDLFSGHIVKTVTQHNRLFVYFDNGSCQSYAGNKPRSEKGIPNNTKLVAIAVKDNYHYLLLKATADIQLLPFQPLYDQPEVIEQNTDDTIDVVATPESSFLNFSNEQYFIVVSVNNNPWLAIDDQSLQIDGYRNVSLFVADDNSFEIYGTRENTLYQNRYIPQQLEANVKQIASNINTYKLIPYSDSKAVITTQKDEQHQDIFVLHQIEQQQNVPPVVLHTNDNAHLNIQFNQWAVAVSTEAITFYNWDKDQKINGTSYTLQGKFLTSTPDCLYINPPQDYIWLRTLYDLETTEYVSTAMIILIMFTAFSMQQKQTRAITHIQTASSFKRIIALLIDLFPCCFITSSIQNEIISVFIKINEDASTINAIELINYSPEYQLMQFKFYFTLSIVICLYFLILELLLKRTPGKMIMKLFIVNEHGEIPTILQTTLRNITRVVEVYPRVPLFMLILITVSRKKQRLGDLLAKTIVTPNTPEEIQAKVNYESTLKSKESTLEVDDTF